MLLLLIVIFGGPSPRRSFLTSIFGYCILIVYAISLLSLLSLLLSLLLLLLFHTYVYRFVVLFPFAPVLGEVLRGLLERLRDKTQHSYSCGLFTLVIFVIAFSGRLSFYIISFYVFSIILYLFTFVFYMFYVCYIFFFFFFFLFNFFHGAPSRLPRPRPRP